MKILYAFIFCLTIAAAIFGGVKRQTYTDLTKQENYLEMLEVAELSADMAKQACSTLAQELLKSPVILRVSAAGEMEHFFSAGRQKVLIEEVYTGDGLEAGQEIYVTFYSWGITRSDGHNTVQRGFVNIMKKGYEYLIFLSEETEAFNENTPVFRLMETSFIAPVFCCEDRDNIIVPTTGDTTYVPYALVKENEFFAESEAALNEWEKLKESLLKHYFVQ